MRDRGQCLESIWPYDPTVPVTIKEYCHPLRDQTAWSTGSRQSLLQREVWPPTRRTLREIGQSRSLSPCTTAGTGPTKCDARVASPCESATSQPNGGHALVAVGYQNSPNSPGGGYFIVRNSWGIGWAYESPYGAGYGTIPYQYISNDAWEAYSIPIRRQRFLGQTGRGVDAEQ